MNPKKKAILDRIKHLEEAVAMSREFLETGKHAQWQGFQPMFDIKERDGKRLPPHKDWVRNFFLPMNERALRRQQDLLDKILENEARSIK